jgi:high affinity Mn2+ porin
MNACQFGLSHKPRFRQKFKFQPVVAAISLALSPLLACAADPVADNAMLAQLKKVVERMELLEQRNQELEKRVQDLSKNAVDGPSTRLQAIEMQQQSLKNEVQALARPAATAEEVADDGPKFTAGVLGVYQGVNATGSSTGKSQGRINYRGDVTATLQAGSIGDAKGSAFGQLRFGQGNGVSLRPTYSSTANTTAFEAGSGSQETYAVVAQAWYQLEWPLDGGRFNDQASSRVEMTVGKMDLFGFFDQNAVAADEGSAFMNNAFVHNPLLDSGGDTGADAYGFAPGIRVGYFNEGDALGWGVSMGVFASGAGADFSASPGKPMVIGQFEISPKQINGAPRSTYRVYAWTNGRSTDFDGADSRHSGFGISADQKIGRDWNLFGRYGQRTSGSGTFNRALTLGFEHGGRAWGRGSDAFGVAAGVLGTSSGWRAATSGGTLTGYEANGSERIAEIYYRYKLNDKLSITPDFQLIQHAGGDVTAPVTRIFAVRANLGF